MIKTIVILTVGKTGSSFLSSLLSCLGIYMGKVGSLWEDESFARMENQFLKYLNKSYFEFPSRKEIIKIEKYFREDMLELIKTRSNRKLWGWKNPRTALSARIWHRHLTNPYYIWLMRSIEGNVGSLIKRYRKTKQDRTVTEWVEHVQYYNNEIESFLKEYSPPYIVIKYEDCFDNLSFVVKKIATFLEVPYKDCSHLLNKSLGKSWVEIK